MGPKVYAQTNIRLQEKPNGNPFRISRINSYQREVQGGKDEDDLQNITWLAALSAKAAKDSMQSVRSFVAKVTQGIDIVSSGSGLLLFHWNGKTLHWICWKGNQQPLQRICLWRWKILVIPAKAQISAQPLSKGLFHDSFQRDFHRQASPPRNIIVIT